MVDNKENSAGKTDRLNRRKFLQTTAAAGAGIVLNPAVFAEGKVGKNDHINVALIGLGEQCSRLMEAILEKRMDQSDKIRFKAVCDIRPFQLNAWSGRLQRVYKHDATAYENYKEMLEKEKGLDAAIIVTPDWMHAAMTIDCLKAGLHVYCEKEMSNSLEDAKKMVQTAKETGKLLQIGHQRRSNPRYLAAKKIISEYKLLGKLLNINAQWNRSVSRHKVPLPKEKIWLDEATLKKYGYDSMEQLINWRWYKKFGGGPLGDLGSHQIDVFNWFLGEEKPTSVLASGSNDFYNYEHNENVMAIYEYKTKAYGSVRAFYQVLNTTCWGTYGGYHETFMGQFGTLLISERIWGDAQRQNIGWAFLEKYASDMPAVKERWDKCVGDDLIGGEYVMPPEVKNKSVLKIGPSVGNQKAFYYHPLLTKLNEKIHQPHLKNFFDAVRGKVKLNCPGEIGYETAVAVLKANEAIAEGKKFNFTAKDFEV